MAAPAQGFDTWLAERFNSAELAPVDIAMNKVRDLYRADERMVEFAASNKARIQALGLFPEFGDFSLVPGVLIWPDSMVVKPSSGVIGVEVKLMVSLRMWLGSINPLGDWSPGIATLLYHSYRILLAGQQLDHRVGTETKPLADRFDAGDVFYRRDRNGADSGPVALTLSQSFTYNMTTDPETGQPWDFLGV